MTEKYIKGAYYDCVFRRDTGGRGVEPILTTLKNVICVFLFYAVPSNKRLHLSPLKVVPDLPLVK